MNLPNEGSQRAGCTLPSGLAVRDGPQGLLRGPQTAAVNPAHAEWLCHLLQDTPGFALTPLSRLVSVPGGGVSWWEALGDVC